MREILFRGKRIDNAEWAFGYAVCCGNIAQIGTFNLKPFGIQIGNSYEVNPATVGQYTGLTDKNGVRIFEGDVVAAGHYRWKCQVVWDEKCARFICFTIEGERKIVYVDMVDKHDKSVMEVIGNIHDTPELLREAPHA